MENGERMVRWETGSAIRRVVLFSCKELERAVEYSKIRYLLVQNFNRITAISLVKLFIVRVRHAFDKQMKTIIKRYQFAI